MMNWVGRTGRIPAAEMLRTFNCGLGLLLVVKSGAVETVGRALSEYEPQVVGRLVERTPGTSTHSHSPTQGFNGVPVGTLDLC